jgi:hypothetical protein
VPSEITISSADILAKAPVSLNNPDFHRREKAIGFIQALRIPVLSNRINTKILLKLD